MRWALLLLAPVLLSAQAAFEVASIKPSAPQPTDRVTIRKSTDQGRLNYQNISLQDLISEAWRVQHRQISGPDWLSSQRFDIVAKLPEGVGQTNLPEMLKALLTDRFALKLHEEAKEMSIYAILPAKTGLRMKQAPEFGYFRGNNGKVIGHITATASLAQLADSLSGILDRPVVDQSGLDGFWVIDLQWTLDSVESQSVDTAAPSIFTAMQEQLGLRLVPTRVPVRQLVVDHAEKTPSEN